MQHHVYAGLDQYLWDAEGKLINLDNGAVAKTSGALGGWGELSISSTSTVQAVYGLEEPGPLPGGALAIYNACATAAAPGSSAMQIT